MQAHLACLVAAAVHGVQLSDLADDQILNLPVGKVFRDQRRALGHRFAHGRRPVDRAHRQSERAASDEPLLPRKPRVLDDLGDAAGPVGEPAGGLLHLRHEAPGFRHFGVRTIEHEGGNRMAHERRRRLGPVDPFAALQAHEKQAHHLGRGLHAPVAFRVSRRERFVDQRPRLAERAGLELHLGKLGQQRKAQRVALAEHGERAP